jgi:hypothetical protein
MREPAPMTNEDQTIGATRDAQPPPRARPGWRGVARRCLRRVAGPYARHRRNEADMARTIARLDADFQHVRQRHTEQIERLEDIARELVLAVEAVRHASERRDDGGER